MRNGARKSADEREQTSTGVFTCRVCKETKPLSAYYPNHAKCIVCHRASALAYKRRNRMNELRERRIDRLAKSLIAVMDAGDCPMCGAAEHEDGCLVRRLQIALVRLGWNEKRYWAAS
jgi:hypothetical protein